MTMMVTVPAPPVPPPLPVYTYGNPKVQVDEQQSPFGAAIHYASESSGLRLSADITGTSNGQSFIVPITLPGTVGLPMVRFANGQPTNEEVYLETSISNGHMVAYGTLPSGAWKLVPDRVNRALAEINAPFRLDLSVVTFIISRG